MPPRCAVRGLEGHCALAAALLLVPVVQYFITPRPATAAHFTAYLAWFACGITSFVAAWLFIRTVVNIGKMVRGAPAPPPSTSLPAAQELPCVVC